MLFGVVNLNSQNEIRIEDVLSACDTSGAGTGIASIQPKQSVVFANMALFKTRVYQDLKPVVSEEGRLSVVFSGQIYNKEELARTTGIRLESNLAKLVLDLYRKHGQGFVNKINGKFAYAIWDRNSGEVVLGRDRFGIEPLYYYIQNNRINFSTTIAANKQ